jgi:hypothetical protein
LGLKRSCSVRLACTVGEAGGQEHTNGSPQFFSAASPHLSTRLRASTEQPATSGRSRCGGREFHRQPPRLIFGKSCAVQWPLPSPSATVRGCRRVSGAYLRGEPNHIKPGTDEMAKAEIAKKLVDDERGAAAVGRKPQRGIQGDRSVEDLGDGQRTHPIFRRFVSSATEMARLANKPLRPLISDVLGHDFSCAVTRALQL